MTVTPTLFSFFLNLNDVHITALTFDIQQGVYTYGEQLTLSHMPTMQFPVDNLYALETIERILRLQQFTRVQNIQTTEMHSVKDVPCAFLIYYEQADGCAVYIHCDFREQTYAFIPKEHAFKHPDATLQLSETCFDNFLGQFVQVAYNNGEQHEKEVYRATREQFQHYLGIRDDFCYEEPLTYETAPIYVARNLYSAARYYGYDIRDFKDSEELSNVLFAYHYVYQETDTNGEPILFLVPDTPIQAHTPQDLQATPFKLLN